MKKGYKYIIIAAAAYCTLLVLLILAEANAEGTTIRSLTDAIWFSIVTFTTVGYGDSFPVTLSGRLIGLLFIIGSVGFFSTAIGFGVSFINGAFIPRIRLRMSGAKNWHYFYEENEDTSVLAEKLAGKESLIIFASGAGRKLYKGSGALRTDIPAKKIYRMKPQGTELKVYFIEQDDSTDYSALSEIADTGIEVFALGDIVTDGLPPNVKVSSRSECLSRYYWKENPLKHTENKIVLIGDGKYAEEILTRALLTNVFEEKRRIEYHVFGDFERYKAVHFVIAEELSQENAGDLLKFYDEQWEQHHGLISQADRVIICGEYDDENISCYQTMSRFYATSADIHVRLTENAPGIFSFGTRDHMMTPEFIVKRRINALAEEMNAVYNRSAGGGPAFSELSQFLQQSNIAAADHMFVKVKFLLSDDSISELTPEICEKAYERYKCRYAEIQDETEEMEHRRWIRFHQMYNWGYAPVRDNAARKHPMMVPFEDLSESEKRKDDFAWEIIGKIKQ